MKLLFITSRFPFPIDKGDKLRVYHQIRILSKFHEIFLFALSHEKVSLQQLNELKKYVKGIKLFHLSKVGSALNLVNSINSDVPLQSSFFYSKKAQRDLDTFISQIKPDFVFYQLIRTAEYKVRSSILNQKSIFDYIDVLSKGLERRIEKSNIFFRPVLSFEYKQVLAYEKKMYELFDELMIITNNDKEKLPIEIPNEINVFPNGIDLEFFKPQNGQKDIDLLFCGNMSYPPNVTAVENFIKNIFPKVLLKKPDINFYIVGSEPSRRILKYHNPNKNIIVTGWVEDIREYYSRAKVFVAPMLIGTGLQNKILEAMAMEVPAVITSLAQGGVQASNNVDVFIEDDYTKFSEAIIQLLNDAQLRNSIGKKAREFIVSKYSWEMIGQKINDKLLSD